MPWVPGTKPFSGRLLKSVEEQAADMLEKLAADKDAKKPEPPKEDER